MAGLFGKKATREEVVQKKTAVTSTGGKIDEIVMALIAAAPDDVSSVRDAVAGSLLEIGRKRPELVLTSIMDFLAKNQRADESHRVILLRTTHSVLELKRDDIPEDLALDLMAMAFSEMVREKEISSEWQGSASMILVSLGMRFPKQLMEELMKRFAPGTLPHYFIMKTLGDLAIANPMAVVPMLKEVFARILPVLGAIKHDNMRWVFASTLGFNCEAILNYLGNSGDEKEGSALSLSHFSSEVFPAYEFIFNNWLSSGKEEVRLATVQSIGYMCPIMEKSAFEAQLPKLVPTLLTFFRKEKRHLPVAQGICLMLEAAVKGGSRSLEPQLPLILMTLHPMAVAYQQPDPTVPHSLKTANELLRSFEILGRVFADPLLSFLVKTLESRDAPTRSGTLRVLRHLVNSLDAQMTDERKKLVLAGVQPLVHAETWRKVRKVLAELVIAMASKDYLLLEGGHQLVEFVVRNAAITDAEIAAYDEQARKRPPEDNVSPLELRSICDNILNLITTTIPRAHRVLWPGLLELLVKPALTPAMLVMCKSLTFVATQKRTTNADDYRVAFDRQVNLPKPQAIITRLLVLLNYPFKRAGLGISILEALRAIGPVLHPAVAEMWDTALPKLVSYLERKGSEWNQGAWEDLVLRLMAETIKHANDDEWNGGLAEHIAGQFEMYSGEHELKRCAFRHTGLILQKISHKELIKSRLDAMFAAIDHGNDTERVGLAQGFGFAAASHLDVVVEKLHEYSRAATPAPNSGGLMGLFSSKPKGPSGPAVNTLILAFGFVSAYAPPTLIVSRMEVNILSHLKPFIVDTKVLSTREHAIKSLDLIGKAMHPAHLKKKAVFAQRDDLIKTLLGYITPFPSPEVTNQLVSIALPAIGTLVILDPLAKDVEALLLERTAGFYKLAKDAPEVGTISSGFNELLASILLMDPTTACLSRLVRALEPWVMHAEALCRERACETVLFLLKKFVEYKGAEKAGEPKADKRLVDAGRHLALMTPRASDPQGTVRRLGIEAIQMLLYIAVFLRRSAGEKEGYALAPPEQLRPLSAFKERAVVAELHEQFAIVQEVSGVMAALLVTEEVHELLVAAVRGLNDVEVSAASGTCVMLNTVIKARGAELAPKVRDLVAGFVEAMPSIRNEQTTNGTLHSLRALAASHLPALLDTLLEAPVPHAPPVVKAFQVLAKDDGLVMRTVNHLTHILNNTQVQEEKSRGGGGGGKTTTEHAPRAISATAALGEVLQAEEMEGVVREHYYLFAATLLLRVGTASGSPEATAQVSFALRQFVACSKDEQLAAVMDANDNWKRVVGERYPEAVGEMALCIGRGHTAQMQNIFQFMLPYLKGSFLGQRIVTAATFAAFVQHTKDDRLLLQQLVNCLLSSLSDTNIKMFAIVGLGNIGCAGTVEANKYAPTVLDALMSGIDDANESIAMEAMKGLAKVFDLVEEQRIAPTLVNICLRIRPALEKTFEPIRSAAFALFGSLYRFGSGSAAHMFNEQIHNNLPSLILHVNDESPAVQAACKKALRQLGPLVGSDEVNTYLQSKVLDESRALNYDDFLGDLSRLLIASFPERLNYYAMTCVDYFKSNWPGIKSNAAMFAGHLLGSLTVEQRKTINLSPALVVNALVQLLKEKSPDVRKKAALALGMLTQY